MNPIRFGGRTPKPHRHVWVAAPSTQRYFEYQDGSRIPLAEEHCGLCGKPKTEASRRSRNNRLRGKRQEHDWCQRLGLRQTGGLNQEDDGLNDLFVGQAKSMSTARFPGWMSTELDKLRARWADRIPILGILETPGPGKKPRRLVVIDERDWIDLHVGTTEDAA